MGIVVLTRKRESGPGVRQYNSVPAGRLKVWSKSLGRYVVDQPQITSHQYGFKQVTFDNVHQIARKRGKGAFRRLQRYNTDEGGDFSMFNTFDDTVVRGDGSYRTEDALSITTYDGGFLPINWVDGWISASDLTNCGYSGRFSGEFATDSDKAPTAWKRFRPRLYVADMGQFVGEIRETLPMLRTTAKIFSRNFIDMFGFGRSQSKKMTRSVADHWLNLQFGWRPFVDDLYKFITTFCDYDARLRQLARDNGQFIRRRGLVSSTWDNPVTIGRNTGATSYIAPNYLPNGMLNSGPYPVTNISFTSQEYVVKYITWFVGCYRYWVPDFATDSPNNIMHKMRLLTRMYGLRLTPTLVWNLLPWSWLADWCGNIGDNLDSFSTELDSNLMTRYAYIMRTTVGTNTISAAVTCGGQSVGNLTWRRGFVVKQRRHANQFGLAADSSSFTAKQWSILAALGIPRLLVESKRG